MKFIKYILIIIATIIVDQLSKFWIVSNFDLYESQTIIDGFLSLKYVQNTGAGFSILEGKMLFLLLVTCVALIFLLYLLFKANDKAILEKVSISLMIGGALGNFIDRLNLGYVVDFIACNIFGYPFPVFNLADSFLTIGVLLFIINILKESRHGKA